jgi:hypothetical protein
VEKLESQKLSGLIRDLQAELRSPGTAGTAGPPGPRPQVQRHEMAQRRIEAPLEILDWAMRDRRWSFTLAEIMTGAVARPRELAARLVLAIVDELDEEDELLAAEAGATT